MRFPKLWWRESASSARRHERKDMLKAEALWPHLPGTGRKEIEVVPQGNKAGTYHA